MLAGLLISLSSRRLDDVGKRKPERKYGEESGFTDEIARETYRRLRITQVFNALYPKTPEELHNLQVLLENRQAGQDFLERFEKHLLKQEEEMAVLLLFMDN